LVEYDNEDEDDGYESHGPGSNSSSSNSGGGGGGRGGEGSSSSIGVITPYSFGSPHAGVEGVLMEGLGTDVARKYGFKHGEQGHVWSLWR
jgi:hypothetical protein